MIDSKWAGLNKCCLGSASEGSTDYKETTCVLADVVTRTNGELHGMKLQKFGEVGSENHPTRVQTQ